jgi:DNA-binding PadR family transcriptional regulator
MSQLDPEAGALLPLTPTVFHILLALAQEPRHGYWIMQEVQRISDGRVGLGPGTLYGAIERMVESGLVEETSPPHGGEGSGRRRYYRLTALGQQALLAESRRMENLVEEVKARRVAQSGGAT